MVSTASSEQPIPRIVQVTRDGAEITWASLTKALLNVGPLGFIAVDTEFTGWGGDPRLVAEDMQERYKAVSMVASTRAIVALGISVFDVRDHEEEEGDGDGERGDDGDGGDVRHQEEEKDVDEAGSESPAKRPRVAADRNENGKAENSLARKTRYKVATFNILMKCKDDFVVSPESAIFLLSHGFNLNEMFTHGVEYQRACSDLKKKPAIATTMKTITTTKTAQKSPPELSRKSEKKRKRYFHNRKNVSPKEMQSDFEWAAMPRGLLWRLGLAKVPIVVHNGFLDLALMYAAFQDRMPDTLQQFCEALLELFPSGVYDTKYISQRITSDRASYLAYVYAKAKRKMRRGHHIAIETADDLPPASSTSPLERNQTPPTDMPDESKPLCQVFAVRGFCKQGQRCPLSHSVERVLDQEDKSDLAEKMDFKELMKKNNELVKLTRKKVKEPVEKARLSKKRKRAQEEEALAAEVKATSAHSAGYDALCTGYTFASNLRMLPEADLVKAKNRVHITGKQLPLLLCKSQFSK